MVAHEVVLVFVVVLWLRGSWWYTSVGVEVRCRGVGMVVLEVVLVVVVVLWLRRSWWYYYMM